MLESFTLAAAQMMTRPFVKRASWRNIFESTDKLLQTLQAKVKQMRQSNAATQRAHQSDVSSRSKKDVELLAIPIEVPCCEKFAPLAQILSEKAIYDIVCLESLDNALFPVTNPLLRYRYLNELALPFPTLLYRAPYSGNIGTFNFLFRVSLLEHGKAQQDYEMIDLTEDKGVNLSKVANVCRSIEQALPEFHSRAMRRTFVSKYGLIEGYTSTVLNDIYRFLTNDLSSHDNASVAATHHRLTQSLHSAMTGCMQDGESEIVVDLRAHNGHRESVFTQFWQGMSHVLEGLRVAEERRSGTIGYFPAAISLPDLLKQVKEVIPSDAPIPSIPWIL
jgi:hypothetical protein